MYKGVNQKTIQQLYEHFGLRLDWHFPSTVHFILLRILSILIQSYSHSQDNVTTAPAPFRSKY